MPAQSLSLNAPADSDVTQATAQSGNKPERLRWFGDLALGLFIHWSLDVQLGVVISHSLVDASRDYVERYFTELPRTFCPTRFDPGLIPRLMADRSFANPPVHQ
jgi:alpha-L-fucosidase